MQITKNKSPKKTSKLKRKINWQKFMSPFVRKDFNSKLEPVADDHVDLSYEEFGNHMKLGAKR